MYITRKLPVISNDVYEQEFNRNLCDFRLHQKVGESILTASKNYRCYTRSNYMIDMNNSIRYVIQLNAAIYL